MAKNMNIDRGLDDFYCWGLLKKNLTCDPRTTFSISVDYFRRAVALRRHTLRVLNC